MTRRQLYLGPLTDSRRWDHVAVRPDDIIVVTPPKCGTTWMQTIIALLLSGDPQISPEFSINMPWIDIRFRDIAEVTARLEAMTTRRSMKSHTPMDGLPLDDDAQYIAVFRHPLDAHFSFRKHVHNIPLTFFDHWYPEDDPEGMTFRRFMEGGPEGFDTDANTLQHILRHYRAALAVKDRPNVTFFHFADMTRDLAGTFLRLSTLLGIDHPPAVMDKLVEAARFQNMKANADRFAPSGGKGFFRSDAGFFDSGSSGKWEGQLSEDELAAYDAVMDAHLTPAERAWIEWGDAGS